MLFTDEIKIHPISVDNFGAESADDITTIKAYIENNSRTVFNASGQPTKPDFFMMLPYSASIAEGDTIEIIKLHGSDPVGNEIGLKQIKSVKRVGGFSVSHLEVFV